MVRSLVARCAVATGVCLATAVALPAPAGAAGGIVDGLSTSDFAFVNGPVANGAPGSQLTLGQTAAAAATRRMTGVNRFGELLVHTVSTSSNQFAAKNAYGHGAGVSAQLGSPPGDVPMFTQTRAEALSPPPSSQTSTLADVPAAPLATAHVLPSTAMAATTRNTGTPTDFCPTLGGPISLGTTNVTQAAIVPSDSVAPGFALASLDGAVRNTSVQFLASNGQPNGFGLDSESTMSTADLTLFKNVTGASIRVQVVAPVTLRAFAAGVPGRSVASFGDNGNVNVVKVTTSGGTVALTLNQLLGGGATIDLDGLVKVHIGLDPTTTKSADGTQVNTFADLVQVAVVGAAAPTQGSVGGPLGSVLNPILTPVLDALNQTTIFDQIDTALQQAGLTQGADLRIGHFESRAQVPASGITCVLPVEKDADPRLVHPGDRFTYTITVHNPFHCPLSPVRLDDDITADAGVSWSVVSTHPTATTATDDAIAWKDIGPIASGATKSVTITVKVSSDSAAGRFTDHAHAHGTCTGDAATGNATAVSTGDVTVHVPRVAVTGALPATGAPDRRAVEALALLVLAAAVHTRRRALRRS